MSEERKAYICQFSVIYYGADYEEAIDRFLEEWGHVQVAQTDWTIDRIATPEFPIEEGDE